MFKVSLLISCVETFFSASGGMTSYLDVPCIYMPTFVILGAFQLIKFLKFSATCCLGGKQKPREDQRGACDVLHCRQNMQNKNITLYGETSKGFFPPSCEALSFISTVAATVLLPNQKSVCHRCCTDKPSAFLRKEGG